MTEPGTNSIPGCDGFTNNTAGIHPTSAGEIPGGNYSPDSEVNQFKR